MVYVLLLGLVAVVPTHAGESQDDSDLSDNQYDEGCRAMMHGLHEEWLSSDGEMAFVVAHRMMWALLLDPNAFYTEFAVDTTHLDYFIDHIDNLIFWNPVDTAITELERFRQVALDRLESTSDRIDPKYDDLNKELIDRIRRAKVTGVD